MSKKEKKSKANRTQCNNNSNTHSHNNDLAHECNKENCNCTKLNDCGSLRQGE